MKNEKKKTIRLDFETAESRLEKSIKKILKDYLRGFDLLDLIRNNEEALTIKHNLGIRFKVEKQRIGAEKFETLLNKVFRESLDELLKELRQKSMNDEKQI